MENVNTVLIAVSDRTQLRGEWLVSFGGKGESGQFGVNTEYSVNNVFEMWLKLQGNTIALKS